VGKRVSEKKRLKFKAQCHVKDNTAEEDAFTEYDTTKKVAKKAVTQAQQ